MTFVAAYDACVFPAPHSWKVLYKIAQGTRVTVAGCPKSCDGDVMVRFSMVFKLNAMCCARCALGASQSHKQSNSKGSLSIFTSVNGARAHLRTIYTWNMEI